MKKIVITLAAMITLAGCGEQVAKKVGTDTVDVSLGGYSAYVRMVTTTDGTRCAVMVGMDRGGITCDWSKGK